MILVAEDVAQDGHALTLFDEAHRNACHRRLEGNAAVHQAEGAATDARHRARAVGLENLANDADRIWKILMRGQQARDCTLSQGAVPDLAAARTTQWLGLTGRERREVVVEHEALP